MHPASTDDVARVSSSEKLIGCSSHSSSLDLCSDVAKMCLTGFVK